MKKVKLGIIGLGQRGSIVIVTPMSKMTDTSEIVCVCDLLPERVKKAADSLEEKGLPRPIETTDYHEVLNNPDIDAVYIAVSWEAHVEVACAAMKAGKYVGLEAGGAYSLDDCYRMIRTYEETGTELMLMENCCYGRRELMVTKMIRNGVLGNIVHCSGAYCHDLREEITNGKEIKHYRLRNYIHRNCENYPTHEIGPIAKALNINNGNRFLTLSSFASKSEGLHEYALNKKGPDHPLAKVNFAQGDVITTVLTCAEGQTVVITLNTTLPHAYSRRFEVHGTKGMYMEDNDSIYLDGNADHVSKEWNWKEMWGNAASYEQEYDHPLWKTGEVGNDIHGGIDHLIFAAFINAASKKSHPPIDVYDAATYMCISALSEDSIAKGGAAVAFPDFTGGHWTERSDIVSDDYTLDQISNGTKLYYTDSIGKNN